jgi:hypothetical protein
MPPSQQIIQSGFNSNQNQAWKPSGNLLWNYYDGNIIIKKNNLAYYVKESLPLCKS